MSRACPSSPSRAAVWSRPPVGAPATSDSARIVAATSACRSGSIPAAAHIASAAEQISAAELDSPDPSGTRPSTTRSIPGRSCPASRSAHATPATYAAQPSTDPGDTSASGPSYRSSRWALATVSTPSPRRRTAAYVACGSAIGRQSPAL